MWEKIKGMIKSLWKQVIESPSPEILRQDINIDEWKRIYQGKSDWLEYQEVNVDGVSRKRLLKTINAAKIVCQEMAGLIFSEQPKVDGPKALLEVLNENNFFDNQQLAIERQCALGSQAIKIRVKDGKIKYDYITADNFIPLSWNNGTVTEAAFLDHRVIKGDNYTRVESHKLYYPEIPMSDGEGGMLLEDGNPIMVKAEDPTGYEIKNELFKHDADKAEKADISTLMPDVIQYQVVEVTEPLFVYIKNPIANNQNSTTPVGMSMFGNAIDTLAALDTAFNNMAEAPELCKPRILVSDKLTRIVVDGGTGAKKRIFDTSDRVYRTAPMTGDEKAPIQDLTIPLEHEPIRRQIQTLLDILSIQCGFSAGTISFDEKGGLKTATEIISDNSKTYKTRQKYVSAINNAYIQLFDSTQAMIAYEGIGVTGEYTITWDDSIIEDKAQTAAYWMALSSGSIVPKWIAIKNILKVDETEAKRIAEEVKASTPVNDMNFLGG